jgi:hypothetical protein
MFSKHTKKWELEVLSNLANIVPIKDRSYLGHSTLEQFQAMKPNTL